MDQTEGGTPAAGGQLSGEATRAAAVKRLEQTREKELVHKKPAGAPGGAYGGPPRS